MNISNIIQQKQNAKVLSAQQISHLVTAVADDAITDRQIALFTRAVCEHGMHLDETVALTQAMSLSGHTLQWSLDGPVVDKHSTGGVGDYSSLILAPTLAACGVNVPMISGRGLDHTGGTIDKLESIPGYNCFAGLADFQRCVSQHGAAIIGQSEQIAPADKRIYAVRDATATVVSVPLIVSSILSKKLAEGLDALVIDLKFGNGGFAHSERFMQELKTQLSVVASALGLSLTCVTTAMNEPISYNVGNNLEIKEVIAFLTGERRHPKALMLIERLGSELLVTVGKAVDYQQARSQLHHALDSGLAAKHFANMVAFFGGPQDLLQRPDTYLENAAVIKPVFAASDGHLSAFNMQKIGDVCRRLSRANGSFQPITNHRTGISQLLPIGSDVGASVPLCLLHAETDDDWQTNATILQQQCFTLSQQPPTQCAQQSLIFGNELML